MLSRIGTIAMVLIVAGFLGCAGDTEGPSLKSSDGLPQPVEIGGPLYPVVAGAAQDRISNVNPIVIPDCRVSIFEKQEVPAMRDGQLLFIGTEVTTGREGLLLLPHGLGMLLIATEIAVEEAQDRVREEKSRRIVTVKVGGVEKKFRRLHESDPVVPYQLLAQLDDRLARDDLSIKEGKIIQAKADQEAAEKTRDEAYQRWLTSDKLRGGGVGRSGDEEARGAKLAYERYRSEAFAKKAGVEVAYRERNQAQTVLDFHEIRAGNITGRIKTIYKKDGEAVKSQPSYEPVFQIVCDDHFRIEGLVDEQYRDQLYKGMPVVIEPTLAKAATSQLRGHLREVACVAVGRHGPAPLIVAGGEDRTVLVWDLKTGDRVQDWPHPAAVRAVACTPPGTKEQLCLTGAADGSARLWNLAGKGSQPLRRLEGEHRGAINCVAFTPDGRFCVTGGDDREIILWETASGKEHYRFPAADNHRGAITSLQFTPQGRLISAGRDNTLRIWQVGQKGARLENKVEQRSGDVTTLGVSPDGVQMLFDQGRELRLLSVPGGRLDSSLRNVSGATNFTTFALFSPDGQLVLTAGPSDHAQLWRAPTRTVRGYELRQLRYAGSPATSAAFGQLFENGKEQTFVVTGHKDGKVLVYEVPGREEIDRRLVAPLQYDDSVETSARQMRVWVLVPNVGRRLKHGDTATMAIYRTK